MKKKQMAATRLFWKRSFAATLAVLAILMLAVTNLAHPVLCIVLALTVVMLHMIRTGAYLYEASKWHTKKGGARV